MRRRAIQVRIFRGEEKYVAECSELSIVTQGDTLDEVNANICEAIGLHLQGESLADFGLAEKPVVVAMMEQYPIVPFDLIPTDDCGYTVTVPSLPGCISYGETAAEATRNSREASELHLENLASHR